jgi:hypothetical protein
MRDILGNQEQGVDPHVNILGGTAYVSGLDIDYHH